MDLLRVVIAAQRALGTVEGKAQADLIRCIFGNPFRAISADSFWLNPTVVQLANAAYDERFLPQGHLDPTRLSILADALEEEGASGEILSHLREPGPHVRGCHIIDLLTDRQ